MGRATFGQTGRLSMISYRPAQMRAFRATSGWQTGYGAEKLKYYLLVRLSRLGKQCDLGGAIGRNL